MVRHLYNVSKKLFWGSVLNQSFSCYKGSEKQDREIIKFSWDRAVISMACSVISI